MEDAGGKAVRTFPAEVIRTVAWPPAGTRVLVDGMVAVTEEGTGTLAAVPGIRVAAKSGTAQVGSKSQPRQIAWLVGFLPAYEPRYGFAVMIEGDVDQDLHGGEDTGAIAGKLFRGVYSRPPSLTGHSPPATDP